MTRTLTLTGDADADALLAADPFALQIGMLLDQQVPMEQAFSAPLYLSRRIERPLQPAALAEMSDDELSAVFAIKPALHRFPASMAKRVRALAVQLVDQYDGRAENLWESVEDGAELLKRIAGLPGFGAQKAKIFLALLGKQYGVTPEGWREASAPYGDEGVHMSIADVVDAESLLAVRSYKKAMKQSAKDAAGDPPAGRTAGRARTAQPPAQAATQTGGKGAAKGSSTRRAKA